MRIAFLSPSGELGGAERCLVDLVASVAALRPAPTLRVFAAADGPLLERLRAAGASAAVVPMPPALLRIGDSGLRSRGGPLAAGRAVLAAGGAAASALRHVFDLRRALAEFRPDVVHTNGMKHHLLGALAAPRGARVVWHVRDMVGERPLMARLLRIARSRASGAIAISRLVATDLARAVPRVNCSVVHDAIDLDEFSPGAGDAARLDSLAGFPPARALRVGLVATYARWKGQDVFLEAVRRIPPEATPLPVRYFVIGGPIYATAGSQFTEAELRDVAARLGVSDRVGFVPFQAEPAWLYRALDLAVHASTRPEPFGRTIAEALACGCPVVATRTAGAVEVLPESGNASLVAPGDVDGLARAISSLLGSDLRALGDAGRTTAQRYGRARIGAELLSAYRALGVIRR
jgi:glycosyltransferase involved in cell wall biosynthesis